MWLQLKVVELYYLREMPQKEIAAQLHVSEASVSRMVKRGKEDGFVRFVMPEGFRTCIDLGYAIQGKYGLEQVVVAPLETRMPDKRRKPGEDNELASDEIMKKAVAIEGARYLQRIITPQDVLGIAWGGTIYHLIQYLNPCRRTDIPFITLHGSINDSAYPEQDVDALTKRMAMALGGNYFSLRHSGLLAVGETMEALSNTPPVKRIVDYSKHLTITVSGIGAFYPELNSPLAKGSFLSTAEKDELVDKGVCADFLLHFLDREGNEIDSSVGNRTLAIALDMYKNTKQKILVASGAHKAYAVRAALRAGLVDVLIVDETLADALLELNSAEGVLR